MSQPINNEAFIALEQFAELTSLVIFSYDIDNKRFTYLSPSFKKVWRKSRKSAETNPSSLLETIHPEDKDYVNKCFHKIINGKDGKNIEFRIQLSDKSTKWLCVNAVMNQPESGKRTIIGGIENITAIKEKNKLLKKSLSKKASILQVLAHDLTGPLNNIKGLSSLLKDEFKKHDNPELDYMIEMIGKTSERSVGLIHEFVTQELMESTTVKIIKNRVDIVEKLREIVNQYKNSEEYIGKTFSIHRSQEKIFVKIDEFKIIQVITNLISNAIKFTHDGGDIAIHIEEKEENILITVADNGIGIPANLQDVLFEKFTKARRYGLKGEQPIGLGMSIIKTIVEWHNGKIWFKSEEDKGTTFYIELPKE